MAACGGRLTTKRVWSLRPEHVRLAAPQPSSLQGRIVARVFQGGQILFELDSPIGRLNSIQPAGTAHMREGDAVGLCFGPEALRPLREPAP